MFFDLNLLCRQSDGVFYLPWIAGVFGTKTGLVRISDRNVRNADTIQLCEALEKYVMSGSLDTRHRMSLRLGSVLLHGIVRIYRRKVVLFETELYDFFSKIRRPIFREITTTKKPKTPKSEKKKTKRLPKLVETDQLHLQVEIRDEDVLAALEKAPHAPPELITLPDDTPVPRPIDEDVKFGDEQFPEAQLRFLETDFNSPQDIQRLIDEVGAATEPVAVTQTIPTPVLPVQEVHVPQAPEEVTKKRRRTASEPRSSKRAKTGTEPVVVAPQEPEIVQVVPVEQKAPKSKPDKGLLLFKQRKPILVQDRIEHPAQEIAIPVKIKTLACFDAMEVLTNFQKSAMLPIVDLYFSEDVDVTTMGSPRGIQSKSSRDSTMNETKDQRRVTRSKTPSIPTVEMSAASVEEPVITPIVPLQYDTLPSIIEPAIPKSSQVELPVHSTPKKKRVHSPPVLSVTEVIEAPPCALEGKKSRVITPTSDASRKDNIIEVMREWDFSKRDLTIEDLCQKPINRRNIASVFYDLLSLAKREYVLLRHQPNSLELGRIEKGPKLQK